MKVVGASLTLVFIYVKNDTSILVCVINKMAEAHFLKNPNYALIGKKE